MHVVLCNCPPDQAEAVARAALEARAAACVNLVPGIRSLYHWEGKLCDDAETTLILKTSAERVEALRAVLVEAHPYDVPEVVVLDVNDDASHGPYVDWVNDMCRPRR